MVDVHENAGAVEFGYKKFNINTPIKHINKHTIKIFNQCTYTIIITKKIFYFFFLLYTRMSGNCINFDDKKIKKVTFTKAKKHFS